MTDKDFEEFKQHARVDDLLDDMSYLRTLYEAAEHTIIGLTNRTEQELCEDTGELPKDLKVAVRQLATTWYEHPDAYENASGAAVPYGISFLVSRYRRLA